MSLRGSSNSPPRRQYRRRSLSRSSSRSRSRSRSPSRQGNTRFLGKIKVQDHRSQSDQLKSSDPELLARRVFIGNLPTDRMVDSDLEDWFKKYGKLIGVSLFRGFGFVQFESEECARKAVAEEAGSLYKGFRLDVKMAAEGRRQNKDKRRSPPRDFDSYRNSRDRSPLDSRRLPYSRNDSRDRSPLDDRRGPPRDPYRRDERDYDPYRRMPFDDPYYRAPPKDGYRRDPWGASDPYYRDIRPELPPPPPPGPERPPFDCVIVLQNRQLMGYGEMIERRLKQNMMAVDLQVLLDNELPQVLIDGASRRNIPFAAVVNEQNEVHRSITINILHGTPQEHRNMPLDDAMGLVSRNFEQFVKKLCEKEVNSAAPVPNVPSKVGLVPPDNQTTYLLNLLADGRHLTLDELEKVKSFVDERQARLLESEGKSANNAAMGIPRGVPPVNTRPPIKAGAPLSQQLQPVEAPKDESAIVKQQEVLQAKILSILNTSSAPVGGGAGMAPNNMRSGGMNSNALPHQADTQSVPSIRRATLPTLGNDMRNNQQGGMMNQQGGMMNQQGGPQNPGGSSLPINLDNPNVQKALNNLIQSGPSLIRSMSSQPPSSNMNNMGMQSMANNNQRPPRMATMRQSAPRPPPPQQQGPPRQQMQRMQFQRPQVFVPQQQPMMNRMNFGGPRF